MTNGCTIGNTGIAVRASSSIPGVFQPVNINGREYVDGGLVSPVPVKVAKSLGSDEGSELGHRASIENQIQVIIIINDVNLWVYPLAEM